MNSNESGLGVGKGKGAWAPGGNNGNLWSVVNVSSPPSAYRELDAKSPSEEEEVKKKKPWPRRGAMMRITARHGATKPPARRPRSRGGCVMLRMMLRSAFGFAIPLPVGAGRALALRRTVRGPRSPRGCGSGAAGG